MLLSLLVTGDIFFGTVAVVEVVVAEGAVVDTATAVAVIEAVSVAVVVDAVDDTVDVEVEIEG